MKKLWWILILLFILPACSPSPRPSPTLTPTLGPISTPTPETTSTPTSTPIPDPRSRASAFLEGWKADDYEAMYGLLSSESQAAMTLEAFIDHFRGIAIEAALKGIDYEILSVEEGAAEAAARYRITFHSNLVPDVQDETGMTLLFENGAWRVKWEDTLVMSYLSGANYLSMDRSQDTPPRGLIFDRDGDLLVGESDAYAVGLDLTTYDPEFAEAVVNSLARLSDQPAEAVQARIDEALENGIPYLSFGEYPAEEAASWEGTLNRLPGVMWNTFHSRFYFGSPFWGTAPHLTGYVGSIDAGQLDAYRRLGYRKDELIGQMGLEQWAEEDLLGVRGGTLYVRDGNSQVLHTLAGATAVPSQNITTTLQMDFQVRVQRALSGLPGAAVVLERDTGRVLAMASSPAFDPHAFAPGNLNANTDLTALSSPLRPLYNRATQGQYPLGSVFKIITMAAALESGLYNAESSYECGYAFNDIIGIKLYDWTWDHFQEDGETQPSGHLTLPQGLIRSCNPFFYHIGQGLYEAGQPNAISDMARLFGLGSTTGIQGVAELPGSVPDPATLEDALYLAIGQSGLQVTPLQVASFVAAVGNGGTLYTPQVIEDMSPAVAGAAGEGESTPTTGEEPSTTGEAATPDASEAPATAGEVSTVAAGEVSTVAAGEVSPSTLFQPQVHGKLPLTPENLALIQEAMKGVTSSTEPRGTAYDVFNGLKIPIHGKTGTAQTGIDPHAWFAAYSNANNPNVPDIAVAVIVENGGEGSEWAAPIARRIFELYFLDRPAKLYPWESNYNVKATPEPPPEEGEPVEEGEIDPNLADE